MKRSLPFFFVFIFALFNVIQYFVPHESFENIHEFLLDWIIIIGIFALALGIWSLFKVSVSKIRTRKPNFVYNYLTLVGLFVMILFGFTASTADAVGFYWLFILLFAGIIVGLIQIGAATNVGNKRLWVLITIGLVVVEVIIAAFDNTWGFFFYTQEGLENTMFRNFFDHIMMPILATMFALLAFFIASAAYRAFRARNLMASLLLLAALIVMLRFNPYLPFAEEFWAKASNWLMNVPNLAAQRAIVIGIGLGIVSTAIKVMLGIERGYMGKG